jgi:uncharacterized protein (TIGR02996 family)
VTHEERTLLEAIRADLEDDTLRLVYADWLEENGRHERAEFIRLQIAREAAPAFATQLLVAREQEILTRHAADWLGPLAGAGLTFRRGLALASWKSLADLEAGTARLTDAGDPVWVVERRLDLDVSRLEPAAIEALVQSPAYGRLTGLRLTGFVVNYAYVQTRYCAKAAHVRAVADSDLSANLRGLWLGNADLDTAGAQALATSPHLGRLRRLHLDHALLTPEGLAALAGSTTLSALTGLSLPRAAEGEEAMQALARGAGLPRLEWLDLSMNRIGAARLRRLLRAPWVGRLKELVLAGNPVRDGGANALAGCAALAGLEILNLSVSQIGDAGALALLESPHLRGLRKLDLGFSGTLTEPVRQKVVGEFEQRCGGAPPTIPSRRGD